MVNISKPGAGKPVNGPSASPYGFFHAFVVLLSDIRQYAEPEASWGQFFLIFYLCPDIAKDYIFRTSYK
jgi:hypothetical protein